MKSLVFSECIRQTEFIPACDFGTPANRIISLLSSRRGLPRADSIRTRRMSRFPRLLPAGLLLLSLVALSGCDDPIRTYDVPHVKQRLLGALIETDEGLWTIKLMGPTDDVGEHKAQFEEFVKSIRLTGKGKQNAQCTVPPGWEHEPGNAVPSAVCRRFATFWLPKQREVTVFYFEGGGGGLLRNVNRWRDQLQLEPVRESALLKLGRVEELAGGQRALLLDMEAARYTPLREQSSAGD